MPVGMNGIQSSPLDSQFELRGVSEAQTPLWKGYSGLEPVSRFRAEFRWLKMTGSQRGWSGSGLLMNPIASGRGLMIEIDRVPPANSHADFTV